jgi:hypothetical protein
VGKRVNWGPEGCRHCGGGEGLFDSKWGRLMMKKKLYAGARGVALV